MKTTSTTSNFHLRAVARGSVLSEHQQQQQLQHQELEGKGEKEIPLGGVRHVPWASFPQIMQVVASRRFSEHILIKVGKYGWTGKGCEWSRC
jgi:hypothetical protein